MTSRCALAGAAAAFAVLATPPASAAPEIEVGSWWAGQGDDGTAPPPAYVAEGGPWVASLPSGPTAVTAIRFRLGDGEARPLLTMRVARHQPDGAGGFVACIATSAWSPGTAMRWSERPSWDCEAGQARGQLSLDGSEASIDLSPVVRDGAVDVVLVPSAPAVPDVLPPLPVPVVQPDVPVAAPEIGPTFELAFEPLAADALRVAVTPRPPDAPAGPTPATAPVPASSRDGALRSPATLTPRVEPSPLPAATSAAPRPVPATAMAAPVDAPWSPGPQRWIAAAALAALALWSAREWRLAAGAVPSRSGRAPALR